MTTFEHNDWLRVWLGVLMVGVLAACGARETSPVSETPVAPMPSSVPATGTFSPKGSVVASISPTVTPTPTPGNVDLEASAEERPAPEKPSSGGKTYLVAQGDTLIDLALRFKVPMAAIQLRNELGGSHVIQAGQSLVIPSAESWAHASPFWMVHEVGPGETFGEIANAYGLSQADLLAVNDVPDPDVVTVGQEVVLPLEAPMSVVAAQLPTAVPKPTSIPEPTRTATPAAVASTSDPEPVMATATAMPSPTSQPTALPPVDASADMATLAQRIFRLINEQRAMHGKPPLAWNATLAAAAQRHAEDCYQRGWCGHTGSDGSTMKTRIIRAGYDPVRWSECWAWYRSPELAVAMWMDEVPPNDPHRRTILSDHLTEVGVGVMPGNGHGYYFIADFGRSRP